MKYLTEDGELKELTFKTPYNHDTYAEARRTALNCEDCSLTDQSFKEDADINTIVDRVMKGQELPITLPEHFGDDTGRMTYLEISQRMADASATFYRLPPDIREEFLNQPARWADAVMKGLKKADQEELTRLGLDIQIKQAEAPQAGSPAPGAPETPAGGQKPPAGAPDTK